LSKIFPAFAGYRQKGQNVRLASKLIGWDIDIKSEEEKAREIEEQMTALTAPTTPLTALAGVVPKTIEKIEAAASLRSNSSRA